MMRLQLVALIGLSFLTTPAMAGALTNSFAIDLSQYYVDYGTQSPQTNPAEAFYFNLTPATSSAPDFEMYADPGSNYGATIGADAAGKSFIRLEMNPYTDGCASGSTNAACAIHIKDKVDFDVVPFQQANALDLTKVQVKYIGFDFKLDANYAVGQNNQGLGNYPWVQHFQVWQCCHASPPFAIMVRPAASSTVDPTQAPVELSFIARDDASYAAFKIAQAKGLASNAKWNYPNFYKYGNEIYRLTIPRGQWNNLVLQLTPHYNGGPGGAGTTGQIAMWYNGVRLFVWRGDWGYIPSSTTPLQVDSGTTAAEQSQLAEAGLDLQIYRYPFQTGTQGISFSNVKYGTTYSMVSP